MPAIPPPTTITLPWTFLDFFDFIIDNLVKSRVAPFTQRGRASPPPPFEVNSNGSTLTKGRSLPALGLLPDFQLTYQDSFAYSAAMRHLIAFYKSVIIGSPSMKTSFFRLLG
jgi:hypothetical protein